MNFERFRREIDGEVVDYQTLFHFLRELKKPRDKITSLVNEGKIIRLKRGLYVFGENWRRRPLQLEIVSNLLYGPSYVSFEYALSQYGLLAERSSVITCAAIGDSKSFDTPVGIFEYRALDPEKFKIGIEYADLGEEGGYFIASKEKALIDLVYKTPGIRSIGQLRYFLFEEMRIDETLFHQLDLRQMHEIANVYEKRSVKMLSKL